MRILSRFRLPRGARRAFARAPGFLQAAVVLSILIAVWFVVNGLYQVARKPTELFFPVSGTLNKTPRETWRQYGPLFRKYSTEVMSPELLAALGDWHSRRSVLELDLLVACAFAAGVPAVIRWLPEAATARDAIATVWHATTSSR